MELHQIVQNGLDLLLKNIKPFIEDTLIKVYGNEYPIYMEHGPRIEIKNQMKDYYNAINEINNKKYKDLLFYLNAMIKNWDIFKGVFSTNYPMCLSYNIKYFRNKWAHQSKFTSREVYRLLDECQALLEEMNLDIYEIEIMRKGVLEYYYNEEVNNYCNNLNKKKELNHLSQNYVNYNQIESNFDFPKDETMIDADEIDKIILHSSNYNKMIQQPNQSEYKISYYEEDVRVNPNNFN